MEIKNVKWCLMILRKLEISICFLLLLFTKLGYGQAYILANEELIYSFKIQSGKIMSLSKNNTNEYLVYRFGTKDKVELEYPDKTKDSWTKFKYSYYFRGGGVANEGLDLNYLNFVYNNFRYVIFDTYSASNNSQKIGIKVTDLSSNKTTILRGINKTQKGSLLEFRDNELVETIEELFD